MAVIQFIQAQKFILSGSGSSIGDTTITLQSMVGIDGSNIVTADLGTKCYGTLEPGNGTQEEAISFTGVTQNSNGAATLTGVKSCLFKSPYTETSGLTKTHAGASTFILSNEAAFYNNILTYVNTSLASGAPVASTSQNGIVTLSATPASGLTPVVLSLDDPRVLTQTEKNYLASVVPTAIPYAVATGTALAYTATLASSVSSLASGTHINFLANITSASGATLNINSLGAKSIKKNASTVLASGDILAGQVASVVFDGTNFQLNNPATSNASTQIWSSSLSKDISSTTSNVIAHGLGAVPKFVRVTSKYNDSTNFITLSESVYTNSTQSSTSLYFNLEPTLNVGIVTVFRIYRDTSSYTDMTLTTDATNVTLAWSKTSTPTGTAYLLLEAIA